MRLFVLARHAQSILNVERRVNGDPSREVPLTAKGKAEARALGVQLAALQLDVCVHTRFPRTRRTAEIALAGRGIPLLVEPLFDDVGVGELEGETFERYRAWKREHGREDRFPGGESLDEVARRYAHGLERLLASPYESVLLVCHELTVRYALNGASGSDSLDGPVHDIANAVPFLLDEEALARAADGIERLAGPTSS